MGTEWKDSAEQQSQAVPESSTLVSEVETRGSEQQEAPTLEELQQQIKDFQQRVGTENDVAKVKSQRDQLANRLASLEEAAKAAATLPELSQRINELEYQLQVAQINNLPPEQRQAAASALQLQQTKKRQRDYEESLRQREATINEAETERQRQEIIRARQAPYVQAITAIGGDLKNLDLSSPATAQESMQAEVNRIMKLRESPPRKPAPTPTRGGTHTAATIDEWFNKADRKAIDQVIERARQGGMRLEDILK